MFGWSFIYKLLKSRLLLVGTTWITSQFIVFLGNISNIIQILQFIKIILYDQVLINKKNYKKDHNPRKLKFLEEHWRDSKTIYYSAKCKIVTCILHSSVMCIKLVRFFLTDAIWLSRCDNINPASVLSSSSILSLSIIITSSSMYFSNN